MEGKRKLSRNQINATTQKYLDIAEIKDGVVIMRDGTMRAVLMVSSLNFALKSEEEQDAIVSQYVSFLNSIEFPIQIVVQSRELNIDAYLESLRQKEKEQTNELLKMQTADYIQYVNELITIGRIMSKHFYLVIPYNPLSDKHKTFFQSISEVFKPATIIKMKEKRFLQMKESLDRRIDKVMSGLVSMGLNAAPLDSQALIELYYNTYNPKTSMSQKLSDVGKIRVEI